MVSTWLKHKFKINQQKNNKNKNKQYNDFQSQRTSNNYCQNDEKQNECVKGLYCIEFYAHETCLLKHSNCYSRNDINQNSFNFSYLMYHSSPFPTFLIDDIVQKQELWHKFWCSSMLPQSIRIHFLCHRILWVRTLPKSRVNKLLFTQDLKAGQEYITKINKILNVDIYSYTSFANYVWPLFHDNLQNVVMILTKLIRIIPKFKPCNKYFKIIRSGDVMCVFCNDSVTASSKLNVVTSHTIYNNFTHIKNKLVAFVVVQNCTPNSFELNIYEQKLLQQYSTEQYFCISEIIPLTIPQIKEHKIFHSHSKHIIFRNNSTFNLPISKIANAKFFPYKVYNNKAEEKENQPANNIDCWTLKKTKNPGIFSFVTCCECQLRFQICLDPFNQIYEMRDSFICCACSIPVRQTKIYVNQIIYIYGYNKAKQKWYCIVYDQSKMLLFIALIKQSILEESDRMKALIDYYLKYETFIELYLHKTFHSFPESYPNICRKYLTPFFLTRYSKFKANPTLLSVKNLENAIFYPQWFIGQIVEIFNPLTNNGEWYLGTITAMDHKYFTINLETVIANKQKYHEFLQYFRNLCHNDFQSQCNNNNNQNNNKLLIICRTNNLFVRSIGLYHSGLDITLLKKLLDTSEDVFNPWFDKILAPLIPTKYSLINLYTNNSMFLGGTLRNNIIPKIIQFLFEREIDNIHNSPTNHPFFTSYQPSFDISWSSNKANAFPQRWKTFLILLILGYKLNSMDVTDSPCPALIFRFAECFNELIDTIDECSPSQKFLQLISYFATLGISHHLDIYAIFGIDPKIESLSLGDRIFRWGLFDRFDEIVETQICLALNRGHYLTQSKWLISFLTHGIKTGETSVNTLDLSGNRFITKAMIRRFIKKCKDIKKTWQSNKNLEK